MARKKITTPEEFAEAFESIKHTEVKEPTEVEEAGTEFEYVISTGGFDLLLELAGIIRDQTNDIEDVVTNDSMGEKESSFRLGAVYAKLDDVCTKLEDLVFQMSMSEEIYH